MKEIDIQVQEAQSVPNKMDTKGTTPRHIIIKMPKVKDEERIRKAELPTKAIRLSADFSKETLQTRRDWQEVFKVIKKARTYNLDDSIQQSYHLEWKGR